MDKIATKIVPIFFLSVTGAAIASGFIFAKNSLGESLNLNAAPSPQPISAINPQPVKTIITVMKVAAPTPVVEIKSASQVVSTSTPVSTSVPVPVSNSVAAYTVPEPARYIALGGSSGAPANYANVPNATPSNYQTSASSQAAATTSTQTHSQKSPTASSPGQSNATVSKTVPGNGNGSQAITLASPDGKVVGYISASQSSSGGDASSGLIDISASVSQ